MPESKFAEKLRGLGFLKRENHLVYPDRRLTYCFLKTESKHTGMTYAWDEGGELWVCFVSWPDLSKLEKDGMRFARTTYDPIRSRR